MDSKTNKVFIDNFYQPTYRMGLKPDNSDKTENVILGFQNSTNRKDIRQKVISDIFQSLILHDTISINTTKLINLIDAFGIKDTNTLLKSKRFELLDNLGHDNMIHTGIKTYSLSNLILADKKNESGEVNIIQWIEKRLSNELVLNKTDTNLLLLNAEKYNIKIDSQKMSDTIYKEVEYDLNNKHITEHLHISSKTHRDIVKQDTYSILRLASMNKSLIHGSMLSIDSIIVDAEIKPILSKKLSPIFSEDKSVNLFESYFENLFQKKNIPDLSSLYINKIITLDEYLEVASTFSSIKFRKWIRDNEFDPKSLEADILKSAPQISSTAIKLIRWILPDAIGFINPIAGLAASFADSFIVEKFMQGWHPNIFLDDTLKKEFDKKIILHRNIERQDQIKTRFPNVDRNDKCPCNSGKKFKKCCGQ